MRTFLLAGGCLFALVPLVLAQAESQVVIRVVADGKPAAGAKVWVYPSVEKPEEPAALVADAQGHVRAKVEVRGSWFGYAFARDERGRVGQIDLRITNAWEQPEVELRLLDTERRGGRVTDAQGRPIRSSRRTATRMKGSHDSFRCRSGRRSAMPSRPTPRDVLCSPTCRGDMGCSFASARRRSAKRGSSATTKDRPT